MIKWPKDKKDWDTPKFCSIEEATTLCEKALWGILNCNHIEPEEQMDLKKEVYETVDSLTGMSDWYCTDTTNLTEAIMEVIKKWHKPYQHGFNNGFKDAKKLGISLIEKVIEELKK